MVETNPLLGEEMKKVVRNQIRQNDPPETKQTYDRLINEGFPEEEVMRQLAVVVAAEIYDVLKNNGIRPTKYTVWGSLRSISVGPGFVGEDQPVYWLGNQG